VIPLVLGGVGFKVLSGHGASIDTTSPSGKLVFGIFAALAEFERELIRERTMAGLQAARAFGARDSQILVKVSLPGSLPYIVAGMRVALGRALVYIVVAEQYGAATGLGYLSSVAAQSFQMAAMFVPIVIIAALGAGLNETFKMVERRLEKWKPQKA
jgi:ABC-type nitrate/sulfonate/bicarbonate transport system permease component